MKYLVIVEDCVVSGRNVSAGEIMELATVPQRDIDVVLGSGLAVIRDLYPVPKVEAPKAEAKKAKKAKK